MHVAAVHRFMLDFLPIMGKKGNVLTLHVTKKKKKTGITVI